jgi:Domain of unknown function (DUF4349)
MRHRLPGFGSALSVSLSLLLNACGGAASLKLASPASPPSTSAAPAPGADEADMAAGAPAEAMAAPSPAPASVAGAPGTPSDARPPPTAGSIALPNHEMLDIEANVALQVPKVKRAVRALQELAARLGGVVTNEHVDSTSEYAVAELTLRVPSGRTQDVFAQLEQLGRVLSENVTATDIGKEYFDANLRLSSLEATQRRYQEILTHAANVEEILRVEQELARIRTEIEQVKGNLRWLSDRAARATLHLTLRESSPELVRDSDPEAKFYPSLRLPALLDFGKASTQGYVGAGFALRLSRALSLDLDVLKRPSSQERGPDALLASIGGEMYSELLGGGERHYLNPYLGWRVGYARFDADNQAMLGATVGLELYKSRWFGLDAEARNYFVFGSDRGSHYVLSPALSARLAF